MTPVAGKSVKRKLTVTDQTVISTWDSGKGDGKETHLWRVDAVDEDGNVVEQELRSFAELEIGILIEYEVEPYDSPKHGRSYTLKRPRANTTARVGQLEEQMQRVLERLAAVEQHIGLAAPTS